jgi:hypothetical protein
VDQQIFKIESKLGAAKSLPGSSFSQIKRKTDRYFYRCYRQRPNVCNIIIVLFSKAARLSITNSELTLTNLHYRFAAKWL